MRATHRLLAAVQKGATYLEPGAPTGITGIRTAPAPRTTLLYLYSSTLEKLQEMPSSSVYRQSTEALTKHRMGIIERAKPEGLAEWQARVKDVVDAHPNVYKRVPSISAASALRDAKDDTNIAWKRKVQAMTQFNTREDGEYDASPYRAKPQLEGPRRQEEVVSRGIDLGKDPLGERDAAPEIEAEPALTAEQIAEIEREIGAGLIEEVIDVAEGELRVAQTLTELQAWEDLEEKPVEGQWTYFSRDAHASGTQAS